MVASTAVVSPKGVRTNEDRIADESRLAGRSPATPSSRGGALIIPEQFRRDLASQTWNPGQPGFDLTDLRGKRVKR